MQEPDRAGKETSRVRTRIISPRTPRNCVSWARAAKPRQSTMSAAPGPSSSPSSPNRTSAPCAAERVGERAHRGARIEMTLAGEEETLAETPGEIGFERGNPRLVGALMPARASAKRSISPMSRGGATTSVPPRTTPGTRAAHQSIALGQARPRSAGALSPSQNGASMPPASHDALPPSSGDRSTSVTFAPRSARRQRRRQADDAGADDGRAHRLHSAAST